MNDIRAALMLRALPADFRLAFKAALLAFLIAIALSWLGAVPPVFGNYVWAWNNGATTYYVGSLLTHFALLFLLAKPAWRDVAIVVVAGSAIDLLVAIWIKPWEAGNVWTWIGSGYGGVSLLILLRQAFAGATEIRRRAVLLLGSGVMINLYDFAIDPFINFTATLHPETFDAIAHRIDGSLGFQPSVILALIAGHLPGGETLLQFAYMALPLFFTALYALQIASARTPPVSLFIVFVASGVIAAILYQLCPVAGPRYAFGASFPAGMPAETAIPLAQVPLPPAARNAMPSMHMGWALLLWMNAAFLGRRVRAVYAVVAGLTFLATLGLGEHYLIDLVAAVPLTIAIQALAAMHLEWPGVRLRALLVGGGMTLAWILAVRFAAGLFVALPGLVWVAIAATLVVSSLVYHGLARALEASAGTAPRFAAEPPRDAPALLARNAEMRRVRAMFVISGFAGLMYQVLFSKALALTFGSTSTATYTVLATYMGGMALGAWLGGWLAQRRPDALAAYGLCEIGIGVYCLTTPTLFAGIQALYVLLAGDVAPDAGLLTALRVLLGVIALGAPTVLMGMTLPLLARFSEPRAASLGVSVALLYGANTAGAALGALFTGYLILPFLGVWKTTLVATAANLAVAALAFNLRKRAGTESAVSASSRAATPPASLDDRSASRLGGVALLVLGIGGIVTLALEVNYIHLLAVVAGNSAYAFSLMLFAFLLGLGAGAEAARRMLGFGVSLLLALAWLEIALAGVILAGVYLWESLPAYFASFSGYPLVKEFGTRELVRGLVCWLAMFPPALIIGALYPVAMECLGRAYPCRQMTALGGGAAINTAGNIVGVLLAGFLLLPAIGALHSTRFLAALCLGLGIFVLAIAAAKRPLAWLPAALVAAMLAISPRSFDYSALATGANVYFAPQSYGPVIDHAESVDGGLTTVTAPDPRPGNTARVLLTNGKFQGSNAIGGEGEAQAGFALAPLRHTAARESALVIGYGAGMSAKVLHDAGFRRLDIVDLSADIVRLANTHFSDVNSRVTGKPGVRTYITDGRNFLLLQNRRYDLVTIEVSSIWFAGAASLYNREFYQLVKRRMGEHGVLQQWVQLHHIYPEDIVRILGSLRAEFRYVWLYVIGGQGMIVASNTPRAEPTRAYLDAIEGTAALRPLMQILRQSGKTAEDLILGPAGVDALLAALGASGTRLVSTDDNLALEYSTPKGNVLDGNSMDRNLSLLRSYGKARTLTRAGKD